MTTGIYQLTFANGDNYIGKSVDIENRWKQHADKMQKGTAAKPMQDAYRKYGFPNSEILCTCHENHLDIAEAAYINRNKPSLNTSIPKDHLAGLSTEECDNILGNLGYSTLALLIAVSDSIKKITKLESDVEECNDSITELTDLNDVLLRKRSEEEINQDISGSIRKLLKQTTEATREMGTLNNECNRLNKENNELWKYKQLPWWKKLFN